MKLFIRLSLFLAFAGGGWIAPITCYASAKAQQPDSQKDLAALLSRCRQTPPTAPLDRITCNDAKQIDACQNLSTDEGARQQQAELVKQCRLFATLFHLSAIPVFTILDKNGRQLITPVKIRDNSGKDVTRQRASYFVSRREAESMLNSWQSKNGKAQLHAIPMRLAYQLADLPDQNIIHSILPGQEQIAFAKELRRASGLKDDIVDIPVFFVEKDPGLIQDQQTQKSISPFFLDKVDVQARLSALGPNYVNAKISTISMTEVMQKLLNNLPVTLVPSSRTMEYIRNQLQTQPQ
ncbi:MAG: Tic22 family protein [Cyanobacteria bacterium P01_F01_bin.42]